MSTSYGRRQDEVSVSRIGGQQRSATTRLGRTGEAGFHRHLQGEAQPQVRGHAIAQGPHKMLLALRVEAVG